ncbi:MAG: cytochrome-c peroxidase [Flavisolibacter sp.]
MKKFRITAVILLLVTVLVCCSKDDVNTSSGFNSLPLTASAPSDNPLTAEKIALGKMLFWDPVLSGNKDVACASCHHPSYGYGDGLDLSIGVNGQGLGTQRHFLSPNSIPFAKRNALSLLNTAFNGIDKNGNYDPSTAAMFFDNRVRSLELQSLEPMKTLEEMKGRSIASTDILDTIVNRLKNISQYSVLFESAFQIKDAVTAQNLGRAIASYERTLLANHSPFDEYMRGNKSAMTSAQIQGMNDFVSSGCARCHSGPMFSDYSLHVLSVPDNTKLPTDAGANGSYAFRTPSLRNLSFTAPYMHSGVFNSLDAVLDFYERVGDHHSQNGHVSNDQLDENLGRVRGNDKASIIQFLNALNDPDFDKTIPAAVPSGLHPGGNL